VELLNELKNENPNFYIKSFDINDTKKINRKSQLMLVPVGAINPTIFQITYKIDDCLYTNSLNTN
ncbi:MAG: hypothetical protein ACKPKO_57590, partial [Candidatus Fonsibacter sp.]